MTEKVIDNLNLILKGEHMAIDIYNSYITKMGNNEHKKILQGILLDHKRHALLLSERIQELGGNPEETRGAAGLMAETKAKIQSLFKMDVNELLKQVYDGEDKGIAKVDQLKEHLDEESRELVETMLSEDHNHLQKLEQLIASTGQLVH